MRPKKFPVEADGEALRIVGTATLSAFSSLIRNTSASSASNRVTASIVAVKLR
jgi:hypothetical protein